MAEERLKAVFYARVSTEEEKQLNALAKQVDECRDCIKSMNWELVGEYIDEGKSGTKINGRDEYKRLMEDLYDNKFDVIVIKSQDRLMRNVKDWYIFLDRLITNGKKLYMYIENSFYTSDNALITGIKAILAEEYSRELSIKLKNTHKRRLEKARKGEKVTVMMPNVVGYRVKENGNIEIYEPEAEMIRYIFNEYVGGKSIRQIALACRDKGYTNKVGNEIEASTVSRILSTERYKGVYVLNRRISNFDTKKSVRTNKEDWVEVEGIIPPIVSKEIWEKANEIKASRTKRGRGVKVGNSIFSGKVYCGKCGKKYWKRSENSQIRFSCSKYTNYGKNPDRGCDNRTFLEKDLYNVIIELCKLFVKPNHDNIKGSLLKWLKGLCAAIKNSQGDETITKEIEKQERRKEKLIEAYMDELISKEDYGKKYKELEMKIEDLNKSLKGINTNDDLKEIQKVIDNIDDELKIYMKSENFGKEKTDFLIEHITRITVFEDSFCIELDLTGGVMLAGDGFYQFVLKDGYSWVQTENYKIGLRITA